MGQVAGKKVQKKFAETLKFAETGPITLMKRCFRDRKFFQETLKFSKPLT